MSCLARSAAFTCAQRSCRGVRGRHPNGSSILPYPSGIAALCIGRQAVRRAPTHFEEEKRSPKSPDREIAGEYAPFLLPSQYAKPAPNGQTSIYYLMSTWNPYQVILMRSDVD